MRCRPSNEERYVPSCLFLYGLSPHSKGGRQLIDGAMEWWVITQQQTIQLSLLLIHCTLVLPVSISSSLQLFSALPNTVLYIFGLLLVLLFHNWIHERELGFVGILAWVLRFPYTLHSCQWQLFTESLCHWVVDLPIFSSPPNLRSPHILFPDIAPCIWLWNQFLICYISGKSVFYVYQWVKLTYGNLFSSFLLSGFLNASSLGDFLWGSLWGRPCIPPLLQDHQEELFWGSLVHLCIAELCKMFLQPVFLAGHCPLTASHFREDQVPWFSR